MLGYFWKERIIDFDCSNVYCISMRTRYSVKHVGDKNKYDRNIDYLHGNVRMLTYTRK